MGGARYHTIVTVAFPMHIVAQCHKDRQWASDGVYKPHLGLEGVNQWLEANASCPATPGLSGKLEKGV